MNDQRLERVERLLFAQARNHLVSEAALLHATARVAGANRLFLLSVVGEPVALTPVPRVGHRFFDAGGLAAIRDRGRRKLRRHHADEIVRADHTVQRFDDWLARLIRTRQRDEEPIEEQREDARGVLHLLAHVAHVGRIDAFGLRGGRAGRDQLEALDSL